MIKQFVPAGADGFLQGQLLTDWVRAKQIMRRVKKWAHLNYYVQIEDVSPEAAQALQQFMTPQHVGDCGKNGYECIVRVFGPRLLTQRAPKFFVVQISPNGEPNVSIPLSKEQAFKTANAARGVVSHVCMVIETVDPNAKSNASSIYRSLID